MKSGAFVSAQAARASDATFTVAQALPADTLDVQVLSLSRKFGTEAALLAGLEPAQLFQNVGYLADTLTALKHMAGSRLYTIQATAEACQVPIQVRQEE